MNSGNYEGWKLQTKVNVNGKRYLVSTVGFGHLGEGLVKLMGYGFETMVFRLDKNGEMIPRDLYCERYDTMEDAKENHYEIAELLECGMWLEREENDELLR